MFKSSALLVLWVVLLHVNLILVSFFSHQVVFVLYYSQINIMYICVYYVKEFYRQNKK